MKKTALAVLLTLLLTLSACTPGQDPGQGGPDVQLDPANPITVTVWHYYNGKQQDAFNALVADFNDTMGRDEGIIVESRSFGNVNDLKTNVLDSIGQKVGAFDMPNIFAAYPDTAYEIDGLGHLVDIAPYLTADEYAAYIPSYMEEGSFSEPGTLKIFPIAKSVELFMLNKTDWDQFADATGATIEDFSTLERLTAIAKRYYEWTDSLTPEPNDGKAFFGRDAFANYVFIGARQLGVELLSVENGTVVLNFDKPVLRKLWDNFYVPYVLGHFSSSGRFRSDDMKIGNIIACVGSSAGANFYPDKVILDDTTSYPIELEAFPCPQFEGAEPFAVQQGAGMVVTTAEDTAVYASVQFLKWFTQADRNIEFSLGSGYLPVTKEANDFNRIRQYLGDSNASTLPIIAVSVDMVNNNPLYTPPAFASGTDIRSIFDYSMPDLARADRDTVIDRIAQGESLQEASAEFLTDAHFDKWYEATLAEISALIP